jgi:hypothetical protein
MKSKIPTILFSLVLLLSCTVSKNAPFFKDYGEVNSDSCVLYIARGTSIYGGAVPWSVIIKKYNMNTGKFENDFQIGGIYQESYTPLLLKSKALYSITFGSNILLFSGIPNSQSIYKLTGMKTQIEAIKGNSLGCIGTNSGFHFKKEQIKEWANALTQAESYLNISVKKSLLDAEFEILVPQKNSPLYNELQTLRISGKRSSYVDQTLNRNF